MKDVDRVVLKANCGDVWLLDERTSGSERGRDWCAGKERKNARPLFRREQAADIDSSVEIY